VIRTIRATSAYILGRSWTIGRSQHGRATTEAISSEYQSCFDWCFLITLTPPQYATYNEQINNINVDIGKTKGVTWEKEEFDDSEETVGWLHISVCRDADHTENPLHL
jgi:hypothetical protein